jgi:hypothetical protein
MKNPRGAPLRAGFSFLDFFQLPIDFAAEHGFAHQLHPLAPWEGLCAS